MSLCTSTAESYATNPKLPLPPSKSNANPSTKNPKKSEIKPNTKNKEKSPNAKQIQVNIQLLNQKYHIATTAKTVKELLKSLGIPSAPPVTVSVPLSSKLKNNMVIRIPNLKEERKTQYRTIPAPVKYKEVYMETSGPRYVQETAGEAGKEVNIIRIYYVKNKRVARVDGKYKVIKQPKPRIILCKDAPNIQGVPSRQQILQYRLPPIARPEPPKQYKAKMTMYATAYSPEDPGCGPFTSAGFRAGYGVVAVDPTVIPIHTRLYIEGYGYAIAGDIGGIIKGKRIDLGFPTHKEVSKFKSQHLTVYIID